MSATPPIVAVAPWPQAKTHAPASPAATYPVAAGDYAADAMRSFGDMVVHCVVRLDGTIDAGRFALALRLACDAEPVLGCRLGRGWWRRRWVRREDLDTTALCTLQASDAGADVVAYLAERTDTETSPLLSARIFRGATDTLAFKVNHLVADGGGAKAIAYLVARLYEALGLDGGVRAEPPRGSVRSARQLLGPLGLSGCLRTLRRMARDHLLRLRPARYWHPRPPTSLLGPDAPGRTYVLHHLGPEAFRAMRARWRREGATVNDLLLAAYLQALRERFPPPEGAPLRLQSTVDLRRYLPPGCDEPVCNLSGFCYLNFAPPPPRDFEAMVRTVVAAMARHKQDAIGLGDWFTLPLAAHLLPAAWLPGTVRRLFLGKQGPRPHMAPPAITNIGRIDGERLAFGDARATQAWATASVVYPPLWVAAATGFGESLTLSAGFCESALAAEEPRAVFARMETLLVGD